jgi:parallel beta helix pectate lyase-like protein
MTPATEKTMQKRSFLTQLALMAVLAVGTVTDAAAAAQRTFVASTGHDTDACSLAFPCRSFDVAIAQTLLGGEVIVLDSAGYGPATISQPVSIIAPPGVYGGISVFTGVGLTIAAGGGNVTLRGLTINSVNPAATTGISFLAGTALYVDQVVVTNFPTAGLSASVGASSSVFVTNSQFNDNGTGAAFTASAGTLTVSIDNSLFARNTTGASFGDGTAGTVHGSTLNGGTTGISVAPPTSAKTATIEVRDCTIADNSGVGVNATQAGAASPLNLVSVVSSQVSGNATGVLVTGANSTAYVSDSTITRNATGVNPASSGTIVSGGDNRLVNNVSDGAFSSTVPKI